MTRLKIVDKDDKLRGYENHYVNEITCEFHDSNNFDKGTEYPCKFPLKAGDKVFLSSTIPQERGAAKNDIKWVKK